MKDLILTTAINYDYESLKLFLNSLNRCYTGEVVLFSNYKYKLKNCKYKLTIINTEEQTFEDALTLKLNTIINKRHFWYRNFLNNSAYDRILISDSRDVFFQSNPLEKIADDKLYVAVEDNTIGNCNFNSAWIKTIYGEPYLKKISNENIICAGTIMGNYNTIKKYLTYTCSQLEKYGSYLDTGDKFNLLIDQGIHNCYCNEFSYHIKKFTNKDSIFCTLGYSPAVRLNKEGLLINYAGEEYSVIHQFDRFKWLSNHLEFQVKDSIKSNNVLNFSFKDGFQKSIKKSISYLLTGTK